MKEPSPCPVFQKTEVKCPEIQSSIRHEQMSSDRAAADSRRVLAPSCVIRTNEPELNSHLNDCPIIVFCVRLMCLLNHLSKVGLLGELLKENITAETLKDRQHEDSPLKSSHAVP